MKNFVRKSYLIIFAFILILSLFIPSTPKQSDTEFVILTSDSNGKLGIDLIKNDGYYQINNTKSTGLFQFVDAVITDLENDGEYEIITIIKDLKLVVFSYPSLNLKWEYIFPKYLNSMENQILVIDADGDGIKEILTFHTYRDITLDPNIIIFRSNGAILQSLREDIEFITYAGPDMVAAVNVDEDPEEELFFIYGASLWNKDTKRSGHFFTRYDWDGESFTQTWNSSFFEIGGDTRLKPIKYMNEYYFATVGWYNNPIKIYNSDGELLWNRTVNTVSSEQTADTSLSFNIVNDVPILTAYQSSYLADFDLYIKSYNLLTGEEINSPIVLSNIYQMVPLEEDDPNENIIYVRALDSQGNDNYSFYRHDLITGEFEVYQEFAKVEDNIKFWRYDYGPSFLVTYQVGKNYQLIFNKKSYLIPAESVKDKRLIKIFDLPDFEYDQKKILSYNTGSSINIIPLIFLIVVILLLLYILFAEKKFEMNLEKRWPFGILNEVRQFYKMNKLELPTLENNSEEIKNSVEILKQEKHIILSEPLHDLIYDIDMSSWDSFKNSLSLKIKLADIAILSKLITSNRETLSRSELKKLLHIPGSTFYDRVKRLMEWELLEKKMVSEYRGKLVEELAITNKGKNLILFILNIFEIQL